MFQTQIRVRFNHVDAAGIVFYPRYYEMLNQVVEEWFEQQLDSSFREITLEHNTGIPAASINTQFVNPSRLGDDLDFTLRVERVGNSSLHLKISADCHGQPRLTAQMVLVHVTDHAASPIPNHLRNKMLAG